RAVSSAGAGARRAASKSLKAAGNGAPATAAWCERYQPMPSATAAMPRTAAPTPMRRLRWPCAHSPACWVSVWNSSGSRSALRLIFTRAAGRAITSHLVLEVVRRHLLEDLGPLVAGDVGEILLLALLELLEHARGFEDRLGDVDRALRPQRQADGVGRARVDLELPVADAYVDQGEVGILAQLGDLDPLHNRFQLLEDRAQEIVGHRPGHLDALELRRHRRRLEETDPDRQVQLVVRIAKDDDRGLGDRVQRQPPDGHENEVVAIHASRILKHPRRNVNQTVTSRSMTR